MHGATANVWNTLETGKGTGIEAGRKDIQADQDIKISNKKWRTHMGDTRAFQS